MSLLVGTHAFAADATRGKQIAAVGNGKGAACNSCHGPNGEGNAQAGYPVLAGLDAEYIAAQLQAFQQGTRKNALMAPIAAALSAKDTVDVAAWYAELVWPQPAATATTPANSAPARANGKAQAIASSDARMRAAEQLARAGDWNRGLPACFSCHGPDGTGIGAFPRISGQHARYIATQLQAWRGGTRRNDRLQLMHASAQKLKPQEIEPLATWLANHRAQAPAATTPMPIRPASAPKAEPQKPPRTQKTFTPPPESEIPDDGFGAMVRLGKNIFNDTQTHAKQYVGNGLNCVNCHLDSGRKADSAPMWGAYVLYPAFRTKNEKVNTMQERIQGCFRFSQNGTAPAADSEEVTALVTYFYWLAKGAPTGMELPGRGYPKVPKKREPDVKHGAQVFAANCAMCHGADGQGQKANDRYVFPPLWGPHSFNGGAGMSRVETAVGFIKANMPLGRGNSLSDQDAWDVAAFMNSHERPADPRKKEQAAPAASQAHPQK